MDLAITLSVMAAALVGVVWTIVLEKRPKDPARPLLVPTTPIMFLLLLVLILGAAHLVTIVTGKPHTGRF